MVMAELLFGERGKERPAWLTKPRQISDHSFYNSVHMSRSEVKQERITKKLPINGQERWGHVTVKKIRSPAQTPPARFIPACAAL